MKTNLENTTVKDIAYLVKSTCLKAPGSTTLEQLAELICSSDRYKVYLENEEGRLIGVIQAKQIARKILELSRQKEDELDMLPAIAFSLNAQTGTDIAEAPISVHGSTRLKTVMELMDQNHIREIAVVDEQDRLVGVLEAKNILAYYLQAKAEANI